MLAIASSVRVGVEDARLSRQASFAQVANDLISHFKGQLKLDQIALRSWRLSTSPLRTSPGAQLTSVVPTLTVMLGALTCGPTWPQGGPGGRDVRWNDASNVRTAISSWAE